MTATGFRLGPLGIVIAIALALVAAGPPSANRAAAHERGTEDPNGFIQYPTCHEVIPDLIKVDYDTARDLVPAGYALDKDDQDQEKVNVGVVTSQCEVRIGGKTFHNVINSYWQVRITVPSDDVPCESEPTSCPDNPPHRSYFRPVPQAGSPADSLVESPVGGEFYIFQWVTNNKDVAKSLRRGTGLGEEVARYVPGIEFHYNPRPTDPLTGHPARGAVDEQFFFRAPPPAPSPFHIGCDPDDETGCAAPCATQATGCGGCDSEQPPAGCGEAGCDYEKTECSRATEPYLGEFDVGENYWRDTDAGTVIIFGEHLVGGSRIGAAGGTITSDDPESPLGRLFGNDQTRGTQSGSSTEDNQTFEWITAEFTGDVQWTKCVRNDASPCSPKSHSDPCLPLAQLEPGCDLLASALLLNVAALTPARSGSRRRPKYSRGVGRSGARCSADGRCRRCVMR